MQKALDEVVGDGRTSIYRCVESAEGVEDIVRILFNSNTCRLTRTLQLFVITIHKCKILLSIKHNYPSS
jgi:hypothetical protein